MRLIRAYLMTRGSEDIAVQPVKSEFEETRTSDNQISFCHLHNTSSFLFYFFCF